MKGAIAIYEQSLNASNISQMVSKVKHEEKVG